MKESKNPVGVLISNFVRTPVLLFMLASANVAEATPPDYGDVPRDSIPAAGWIQDNWTDPGGWEIVNVTDHGVVPNDPQLRFNSDNSSHY